MTYVDCAGPYPAWSPASFLRPDDGELVRCHTCAAVVTRLDVAAHLDWHRGSQERLDAVAGRLAQAVDVLGAPSVGHPVLERVRILLSDAEEHLRAG